MIKHIIGSLTLNISFVLYMFLCVPQIIHNIRNKNTKGLSLGMYFILLSSYILDLMYGFGREMQWQYRAVTIVGLVLLFFQLFQLGYYQKLTKQYMALVTFLLGLLLFSISGITIFHYSKQTYDIVGMIDQSFAIMYLFPQIIKNYRLQSVKSLSLLFVAIDFSTAILDTVSAWCLHWDYPSRYGPLFIVMLGLIIFWQFYQYREHKAGFYSSVSV